MQMTCPKCRGEMHQYERSGVTVDQCADCRGIFLDRGELERLIDGESAWHARSGRQGSAVPPGGQSYRDHDSDEYPMVRGQEHGHRPKRRSFLGELFD